MTDNQVTLEPVACECGEHVECSNTTAEGYRWHQVVCENCGRAGPIIKGCSDSYFGKETIALHEAAAVKAWNTPTHRQQSLSAARAEIEGLDWKDAKAISACVVQNACETDPADAEHPDTILITTDDLETIVRSAVEDYKKPTPAALSTDQGREGEANV